MNKYYYRPIKDKVINTYKENTSNAFNAPEDFDKGVVLIIEAETEEIAKQIMIGIVDISMWGKASED